MVAEGNWILGGNHTIEYIDVKLQCTSENYIIVLTNVTPINSKRRLRTNKMIFRKDQVDRERHWFSNFEQIHCQRRTNPRKHLTIKKGKDHII